MRMPFAVFVAALLLLSLPSVAQQEESKAYFSLSSNRTFAPGEKPSVQMWASGVNQLQFRVYKVNDPVRFFEQLEDPHRFGGQAQKPPGEVTLLEMFHRWKRRLRLSIRNVFRMQYSADSRTRIRVAMQKPPEPPEEKATPQTPATKYANVPLLNPQQVVAVWDQPVPTGRRWASRTVQIDVSDKGVYLVEATNGDLKAYTIVSITNLGILSKGSPGRLAARVVDRETGDPVADCPVKLWIDQADGREIRTDRDGLAEAVLDKPDLENLLLMATRGDDFAVSAVYGWNLRVNQDEDTVGYVYTDRPVYRPGHDVHFRAVLRTRSGAGYKLPDSKTVDVEIQGADRKTIYRETLPVSGYGTVEGDLAVPETASLGYHNIQVRAGDVTRHGGFHIEEYRKPEFTVKVKPERRRYLQGEPIEAVVEARYYYGEPVVRGKVTYEVYQSRYWTPWYAEDDVDLEEQSGWNRKQVLRETAELDDEGLLRIRIPNDPGENDFIYRIQARVIDATNREVEGSGFTVSTVGPFLAQIQPEQYVYGPGEKIRFTVTTKDYDQAPVGGVSYRVELAERQWNQQHDKVIARASGQTGSSGEGVVTLPGSPGGSLMATVYARTPRRREVRGTTYVWVSGEGGWSGTGQQRVQIIPDKKSYAPGETAKVLIVTGVPKARLWVTAEGRSVLHTEFVDAEGPTVTVEIPIESGYTPNFFLNAMFLRDQKFYQGVKEIKVPPAEHELQVEITSSQEQFQPGEEGVFTVVAKDQGGAPVQAEFSLGVVDEAVYAVRKDTTPPILSAFYGRSWNRVSSNSSLSYYFSGEAGKRRMQLAGVRRSGTRAQLKPEELKKPKIRKAFPDTIHWVANLRTGPDGRATARVTYPDALTTWRATARGITRDTKVGSGRRYTVSRKNLILTLATPRFFTEGDEVTISAIVRNYLEEEKRVRVSLEAEGLEILEGATVDLTAPSRGEVKADYRVRVIPGREVMLLGKALTNEESDALELRMPVNPYGLKLTDARGGAIEEDGSQEADLAFAGEVVRHSRSLEITLTPSVAGTILSALEYLTSYPYGCTEQTMSSFLPNIIVSRAAKELKLETGLNEVELIKKVRAGLERLEDYQHQDGGWGWWKTDDSGAFMTAYVLLGLKHAEDAGYPVKRYSKARGLTWLAGEYARMEEDAPADLRAYVVHTLVLNDPQVYKKLIDEVWARPDELSPYGLALIGLAMQTAGDARAEDVAVKLEASARRDSGAAWWEVERDYLLRLYSNTSPEATAHALKFLTYARPESPLLSEAATWLVRNRDGGYYWSSTKQTALVIYGLAGYLKAGHELSPDFEAAVEVNGKEVLSRRFTREDALAITPVKLRVAAEDLPDGEVKVRVTKNGRGRLYWAAQTQYYASGTPSKTGTDRKLGIRREYFRLSPVTDGGKIVYRLNPLAGPVSPGDVLAVRLKVEGDEFRYLLIEDPIPSGTEFVLQDGLYELEEKPSWWSYWSARREFRDDRAAFYQRSFASNGTEYVYLLKVVNPGSFRVSPARVFPMYEPRHMAASESRTVEVR